MSLSNLYVSTFCSQSTSSLAKCLRITFSVGCPSSLFPEWVVCCCFPTGFPLFILGGTMTFLIFAEDEKGGKANTGCTSTATIGNPSIWIPTIPKPTANWSLRMLCWHRQVPGTRIGVYLFAIWPWGPFTCSLFSLSQCFVLTWLTCLANLAWRYDLKSTNRKLTSIRFVLQ